MTQITLKINQKKTNKKYKNSDKIGPIVMQVNVVPKHFQKLNLQLV